MKNAPKPYVKPAVRPVGSLARAAIKATVSPTEPR